MAATYRLKGMGWFGTVVFVTLGFYLVSLQVAAERKKLEQLDGRIAAARRDIRSLETEFDTRANLAQLERWNGDTLALAAPRATQFVADEAQLASLDPNAVPDPTVPEVKTAALVVPNAPVALAPQPIPATPVPVTPAPAPVAVAAAKPAPVLPSLAKAALAPAVARAAAVIRPAVAVRAKPEVALLDRHLLSDATLGDILAGAAHERHAKR